MVASSSVHPSVFGIVVCVVFILLPFVYIVGGAVVGHFDKPRRHDEFPLYQARETKSRWRGGGPS